MMNSARLDRQLKFGLEGGSEAGLDAEGLAERSMAHCWEEFVG
jgi:hypothetical protein